MISYNYVDNNSRNNNAHIPYCGMYRNCYGNVPTYGYCPYAAALQNNMRMSQSDLVGYYQYSPLVNGINAYAMDNMNYERSVAPVSSGELKMRTVNMEDVLD